MTSTGRQLHGILSEAFKRANPGVEDAERACRELVFHMTDWEADLIRLADLYSNPEKFTPGEAEEIVAAFLYHASDHIPHAARIQCGYVPPSASK